MTNDAATACAWTRNTGHASTTAETRDRIFRMLTEAKARMHDADILGAALDRRSDSGQIIQVLAFEVLLKAVVLHASGVPPQRVRHNYQMLWKRLPEGVQNGILAYAKLRMAGHTDFSDLEMLLSNFEFVFVKARYYYELYDGYTLAEQRAEGEAWEMIGAPIEEAKVRYYPLELQSLSDGLVEYLEMALGEKRSHV